LTYDIFRRLNEAGFSYRQVILEDILEEGIVPAHKVYIVTNLLVLDKEQRKELHKRFDREGAVVVWLYGNGVYFPDTKPDVENITNLIGVKFKQINKKTGLRMNGVNEFKNIKVMNPGTIITSPWFLPIEGFDKVIAETSSREPAMVNFSRNGIVNYFASVPNLSPEMLRYIARKAGVWIYAETGDPIHVGNDFVVLHAKTGGVKKLNISKNTVLKSVIGPLQTTLNSGDTFIAKPGRTYGFQVVKK
jgi:hypothetical protein